MHFHAEGRGICPQFGDDNKHIKQKPINMKGLVRMASTMVPVSSRKKVKTQFTLQLNHQDANYHLQSSH